MLGLNFLLKIRCINLVNFPIQVIYIYIKHSKVLTHNSTCHDRITMSLNPLHSFARYDKPFPTNIAVTLCDNRSISWNFTFVSTMRWCHCFFFAYIFRCSLSSLDRSFESFFLRSSWLHPRPLVDPQKKEVLSFLRASVGVADCFVVVYGNYRKQTKQKAGSPPRLFEEGKMRGVRRGKIKITLLLHLFYGAVTRVLFFLFRAHMR